MNQSIQGGGKTAKERAVENERKSKLCTALKAIKAETNSAKFYRELKTHGDSDEVRGQQR